jgi:MarR family transcriptional regulator for hemolysin
VDAAAVSRLVVKLEEEGLLKRHPGKDRRCVRLEATPAARREVAVFQRALKWMDSQIRAELTAKEIDQFEVLMEKVRALFADSPL